MRHLRDTLETSMRHLRDSGAGRYGNGLTAENAESAERDSRWHRGTVAHACGCVKRWWDLTRTQFGSRHRAHAGITHAGCHRQPPHPGPLSRGGERGKEAVAAFLRPTAREGGFETRPYSRTRWGEGERGRALLPSGHPANWVRARAGQGLTTSLHGGMLYIPHGGVVT